MISVYCVENPLLDYVMNESYEWLAGFNAKPRTMQLVEYPLFESLLRASSNHKVFPGGSGANTARALALLIGPDSQSLGRPAYSGAVGHDDAGIHFASILKGMGIELALAEKGLPTGVSGVVVSPDHERTMFTHLGACRLFSVDDVSWDFLETCHYLYSTGYMWDSESERRALEAMVERCRELARPFCFDLADPFVVDRYRAELRDWLPGRVSVLFGNRDELASITECQGGYQEILGRAGELAPLVVMKVGKDGCLINSGDLSFTVAGEAVEPRDTTGAGDGFAAGFLYGLLRGWDLERCGAIANRVASRIVEVEGCRVDLLDRADLLSGFPD